MAIDDDFLAAKRGANPTPEERANVVIKQLEDFIRDKKKESLSGMSFPEWQALARAEIADAIKDAEKAVYFEDRMINRLLIIGASTLVTIGFWGAAVSTDKNWELTASVIIGAAGMGFFAVAFEWGARKISQRVAAKRRARRWERVMSVDRRIKRMQREIETRAKEVEKKLEKLTNITRGIGTDVG